MVDKRRHERIADDVRGGVGCRQRDRDDVVGRGEPEQDQDEELSTPPGQELLEHRDAALSVRAVLGHAPVDGQRAKEGQEDEDERGDWG